VSESRGTPTSRDQDGEVPDGRQKDFRPSSVRADRP
jgi:hypothetical protein